MTIIGRGDKRFVDIIVMSVCSLVLLATLRDASKKQAEERLLDLKEAAEKGSSVENGPSAVDTFW